MVPAELQRRAGRRTGEAAIASLLFACGLVSVLTTIGIVVVLVSESVGFFQQIPMREFLTGTRWAPLYSDQAFGILALAGAGAA